MLKSYFLTTSFLCLLCLIYSCASSEQKQRPDHPYPNQVNLKKPGSNAHKPGKAYIDSVNKVTFNSKKALLISGTFADGCTHLQSISHSIESGSLILRLSAWSKTDVACTQALVPFSFLYDKLNSKQIDSHSQVTINGKTHSF